MKTYSTSRPVSGEKYRSTAHPRMSLQLKQVPGSVAAERAYLLAQLQHLASNSSQATQLKERADVMAGYSTFTPVQPSTATTQLKPVLGQITWGVTHAVKEVNGSIYGDGAYEDGEIGQWGELKFGDIVMVDDDDLFMSRRGANQELNTVRNEDGRKKPHVEWIRVLRIKGINVAKLNVFVRRETIDISEHIRDPEASWAKPIVDNVAWDDAAMLAGVKKIGDEYEEVIRGRPEKERGRNICSTEEMDQDDEGFDVSTEFQVSGNRNLTGYGEGARTTIAMQGEAVIGVMQIVIQGENDERYLYVKWLLGSKTIKGAGVALIRSALEYAIEKKIMAVKVDSAMSAVTWYEKRGFSTIGNAQHMNDEEENPLPSGEDEEPIDCGCAEMELQFRWKR